MKILSVVFVLSLLTISSCLKETPLPCTQEPDSKLWTTLNQTQLQADIVAIDDYLASRSITAIEHESGLRYVITQAGTVGTTPCLEKLIAVTYSGSLLTTGVVFDSSVDPIAFQLNSLIAGWQIGFLKLNKGTKATLYIPSGLAYGANGSPPKIPTNANLIFEVELMDFQ